MAWTQTTAMDSRMSFIIAALERAEPFAALCLQAGISRKTGYKWLRRYRELGPSGLADRPRAPLSHGRRMAQATAQAILALRRERPFWGPRKLRRILSGRDPSTPWPAPSTIGDLLRREGLSQPRRRKRRGQPGPRPAVTIEKANDVWCIDFKGWFRTRDGERCDPLTITDAHSRFVLACRIVPPTTEGVACVTDELFARIGQPLAIRSDNGAPFAGRGAGGLSRLSVGWFKRGILLDRIEPGKPQQNGRHERFHRTLKAETTRPPARDRAEQQARFDSFVADFNASRPHEALGQNPPASLWHPSSRPDQGPREPWYDADHLIRRVRPSGDIKWSGRLLHISEPLAGETIGLRQTTDGDWIVTYFTLILGLIDHKTGQFQQNRVSPI